jgi:hypothetical protein
MVHSLFCVADECSNAQPRDGWDSKVGRGSVLVVSAGIRVFFSPQTTSPASFGLAATCHGAVGAAGCGLFLRFGVGEAWGTLGCGAGALLLRVSAVIRCWFFLGLLCRRRPLVLSARLLLDTARRSDWQLPSWPYYTSTNPACASFCGAGRDQQCIGVKHIISFSSVK